MSKIYKLIMSTETENDNLELGFKPNYKELKRWKKTLDKYKEEFDSQYFKIKDQLFEEITKGRLYLLAEIAREEKLDFEKLKLKYLSQKERDLKVEIQLPEQQLVEVPVKKRGRKPKVEIVEENIINPQCDMLAKKKTKTGIEYFTNGIENSDIYNASGNVIGKYVAGQPIFTKS